MIFPAAELDDIICKPINLFCRTGQDISPSLVRKSKKEWDAPMVEEAHKIMIDLA
jgi:hypothetical protein